MQFKSQLYIFVCTYILAAWDIPAPVAYLFNIWVSCIEAVYMLQRDLDRGAERRWTGIFVDVC